MKKIFIPVSWLLALCLLMGCVSPACASADVSQAAVEGSTGVYSVSALSADAFLTMDDPYEGVITAAPLSGREVDFYLNSDIRSPGKVNTARKASVYFYDKDGSVPYMDVEDLTGILADVYSLYSNVSFTAEKGDGSISVLNEAEDVLKFDLTANTVLFSDYDSFLSSKEDLYNLDVVHMGSSGQGNSVLRHVALSEVPGSPILIDLNQYGIHLAYEGGRCLIPVQTFNDVLFSQSGFHLLYNGESLFLSCGNVSLFSGGELTEFGKLYYQPEKKDRPDSLARFAYNELCLGLDLNYGLKETHGIRSFNEYLINTGLSEYLLSNDPETFYNGVMLLTSCYFADGHSSFLAETPYAGSPDLQTDVERWDPRVQTAYEQTMQISLFSKGPRFEQTGSFTAPGYVENGDTAYIIFDGFACDTQKDYYSCELTNDPSDTVTLLLYANRQIRRENSPIKNIVVDLSANGGGVADAAAALIAWFTNNGSIALERTLTGSHSVISYLFDANLNHVFGEPEDSVAQGYNLYCLISPASFSCGNLCPAAFRSAGNVTLLGRRSGGGSCVIQEISTACGALLRLSGTARISSVINGSFYNVDTGVEPDIYIANGKQMYDLDALTERIDALSE